jgi:hypothetical protein
MGLKANMEVAWHALESFFKLKTMETINKMANPYR